MAKEIAQDVSGTAFLVNYSRSKMVDISRDIYAQLWVTTEAVSLWDNFAKNVYPNDDINLSLRNRFFLELLQKFIVENADPIFINIAAGFTNYPFLVDGNCRFAEFDLPNIVELKRTRVVRFIENKKLPRRDVKYFPVDLNNKGQRAEMGERLREVIGNSPSFVAMEGLTYYLGKEVLDDIFRILREVQKKGSIVAFDHWKPDALEYSAMVRLKSYLDRRFGCQGQDWNLFDDEYIKAIKDYTEILSTDISKLELQYSKTRRLQGRDNMVPDNYSVIRRQ